MSVQAITAALAIRGITATEKLLLLALANYADENMECYPSQKRLAEDTCMTDRTVRAAFKSLEDRGMLERSERRRPDGYRASDLVVLHVFLPGGANISPEAFSPENISPENDVNSHRKIASISPEAVSAPTTLEPSENHHREQERVRVDASARLSEVRQVAGDALADPAKCTGLASLHGLTSLIAESPPCDWQSDILPAVESAAAWHRSRDGPGSMTAWTLAVRIARRNRDQRLNPPPSKVYPLERPHDSKQSANLSAALAGAEIASRIRAGRV